MKRSVFSALLAGALAVTGIVSADLAEASPPGAAAGGRSAIYGGGPFYDDGQEVMDTLRGSGFNTVILWSIHVGDNGDLSYNDKPLVSNGEYVGDPGWPDRLRTLKQAPTSVNRIEVSVGSWGSTDWENIDNLMARDGTGADTVLYRNFQALREATGADAINNDDESHYDIDSTVRFAKMTGSIGYANFTLAPYTNVAYWQGVKNGLGDRVDRVYLQGYAGGSGNDPAAWSSDLGMPVDPGLWSKNGADCSAGDSPADVASKLSAWNGSGGIPGGFLWLYDDVKACSGQGGAADYAKAINDSTGNA